MRKAQVFVSDNFAGILSETDNGYLFEYNQEYLLKNENPVSLTLPLRKEPFVSKTLFSFFDGLIPEGWMLDIVCQNWKLDQRDRFGILLASCADPIGNVSIKEVSDEV